jgi:formate dehydrogenase subunit gamma
MVARTVPPPDTAVSRFDRVERLVHWTNATLFAVVMATAAALYIPFISTYVGRRDLVKTIHVYTGLALPIPLLAGVLGRRTGRRLRDDLGRLNRWTADDVRWLKGGWRSHRFRLGKFNPGQKLNAAFTGGAVLLMLATGSMMKWYKPWPLRWRTGATFVHDWIALALFCTITGHIWMALNDRESLGAMWGGSIGRDWVKRHAPLWLDELESGGAHGTGKPGRVPAQPGNRRLAGETISHPGHVGDGGAEGVGAAGRQTGSTRLADQVGPVGEVLDQGPQDLDDRLRLGE